MSENKDKKSRYVFVNINESKDKVLTFFDDLFGISYIYEQEDFYVYKLINEEVYELEDIIDALNVDFGANIKVFETNYLNSENDMFSLLSIYKKNNRNAYSNISKLVLDLVNNNHEDLKELKKMLLYKIENDNDLINIIIAMYKNDLNVSKTANAVYMHRNTVINKLDIIKKTSGLDIQKFYDAIAMYNLIYLKK